MPRTKRSKGNAHPPPPLRAPDTPSAQLLAEKPDTPPTARQNPLLFDGSDSEAEYHSARESPVKTNAGFKINEEYARRFEHNKKREELHRLEEKFGKGTKRTREDENDDDSSSSEDEDDNGELATEELDRDMFEVMKAIRSKDPRIYDPNSKFYQEPVEGTAERVNAAKKEKPMTLREYHVQNLLKGPIDEDEEKDAPPQTFAEEQNELKRSVVDAMNSAVAGESDDEDFLVREPGKEPVPGSAPATIPAATATATVDSENPDEFLIKFMQSRAWATETNYPALEEDDSSDEERAAEFENAFNMRFEDPTAGDRAKLISYSRTAVVAQSLRREEKSGRKKAREEKRKRKEAEKAQKAADKNRHKKLKTEQLMEKFRQIREAAGFGSDEGVEAEVLEKLLEDDWSDEQWESWMQERFGDEYYAEKDPMKKPEFEDDIDITDIVPDFDNEDAEDEEEEEEEAEAEGGDDEAQAEPNTDGNGGMDMDLDPTRPTRKQLQKTKTAQKSKDRATLRKLARAVEEDVDTDFKGAFRYRETTPESFGLTALDVLTAGDNELNSYAGLKKYAPFREADKKKRDRKRLAKKKRLREWRKETFGNEGGIVMPEGWKPQGGFEEKEFKGDEGEGQKRKKRRRKNKDSGENGNK